MNTVHYNQDFITTDHRALKKEFYMTQVIEQLPDTVVSHVVRYI